MNLMKYYTNEIQLFKFWSDFRLSCSKVYSLVNRIIFDSFQGLFTNCRLFSKFYLTPPNRNNKIVLQYASVEKFALTYSAQI